MFRKIGQGEAGRCSTCPNLAEVSWKWSATAWSYLCVYAAGRPGMGWCQGNRLRGMPLHVLNLRVRSRELNSSLHER